MHVHNIDLILTLTGGLTAALLFGYVTHRLGLSPIVGYLIGGTLLGPHTPGFVADAHLAEQMAEIGVILLMFGVGLQFHIEELLAVRRIAIPGAIAQSAGAAVLGYLIAIAAGWSWQGGIIFGIALSVASTVVLIRVLSDNRDLHTQTGHIAVGWLVVEDLFTVIALVLLPVFLGSSTTGVGTALALTALKVTALVAFTVFVGSRLIPYLLDRVAATRSRELFTLTVLVLALGIAVGSAALFDVSMALGAFLAGMVVGRSDYSSRAASDALPMRDAFAVLFFVSVGMLLDPAALLESPLRAARHRRGRPDRQAADRARDRPADAVSVQGRAVGGRRALADRRVLVHPVDARQAAWGVHRGAPPTRWSPSRSSRSSSIPLLYRAVPAIERWAMARPWLWTIVNGRTGMPAASTSAQPAARGALPRGGRRLRTHGTHGRAPAQGQRRQPDRRRAEHGDRARDQGRQGIDAIYGDASHRDTLQAAGIAEASVLVLTSADIAHTEDVIKAGARAESGTARDGPDHPPARTRQAEGRRRRPGVLGRGRSGTGVHRIDPVAARAPPRNRSIANAAACTHELFGNTGA